MLPVKKTSKSRTRTRRSHHRLRPVWPMWLCE
ncbi:MAG: 50S ribosomal protein L32 [Planctomycetota bacterium]